MRTLALTLAFCLLGSVVYAQDEPKTDKKVCYVKLGFSQPVESDEDIPDGIQGMTIDFERKFKKNHFFISSVSVGYRRERSHDRVSGNYVNLKAGHDFKVKYFDLGVRGGAEWGMPSAMFTFTQYQSPESFRYVSLDYNSSVPFINPHRNATLYPVAEVTLSRNWKRFVFEGGVRANVIGSRSEEYRVNGNVVDVSVTRKMKVIPSVFFGFGFGI